MVISEEKSIILSLRPSIIAFRCRATPTPDRSVLNTTGNAVVLDLEIRATNGISDTSSSTRDGADLYLVGGAGFVSGTNPNGGDVILQSGAKDGSGLDGKIILDTLTGWIEIPNTASIGTITANKAGLYVADIAAGNAALHTKTENGQVIKLYQTNAGSAYSVTNGTTDRTYDANSTSLDELSDIVATLISDLKLTGLIA